MIDASIDPSELAARTAQPSVVTIKVDVHTGAAIETAAVQCVGIARLTGANVEFQFEDMIVLVRPRDEAVDVVRRCQKRSTNQMHTPLRYYQCMFCTRSFVSPQEKSYEYDPDALGICPECTVKQANARAQSQMADP